VHDPGTPVYVYGVLAASDQEVVAVSGVEGADVTTVEHAGLAALISRVRADALAAAKELRAHWRVLEEASLHATVVPVRFGTVMASEQALREEFLERDVQRLRELLDKLNGRVQLIVKAEYDEERLLRDVVEASPAVAALRERVRALPGDAGYYDQIRLGELVAGEVARRREADTRLALDVLEPHAVAAREEQATSRNSAFNLAFLVDRDAEESFGIAVAGLSTTLGDRIDIRFLGPLPPYSFTDADLGAGIPAWA